VSYCPPLTASGLHGVVVNCSTLVSLNLSGCIHLTDESLVSIIATCHKLVGLELAFCRDLTDAVLLAIAMHLSLEVLNVGRCVKVTDDGMREVVGQLTVLRKLNVSACKRVTDKTLVGLLEACPLLEELDVAHCPLVSTDVLSRFVRRKVKVLGTKIDELSVTEAVEQELGSEPRLSARTPGREDSEGREGSNNVSGQELRPFRNAVSDAKTPTRTTRLPGSDVTLPLIRQRPRDP
jgi:hypothetical protein